MTRFEIASLIISVIALAGSIWSISTTSRTGKQQNKLQERLLNLEEARERDRQKASRSASLHAWIEREPDYTLIIRNEGDSEARSIRTLRDGQPILSHPLVPRGLKEIFSARTSRFHLISAGRYHGNQSCHLGFPDLARQFG